MELNEVKRIFKNYDLSLKAAYNIPSYQTSENITAPKLSIIQNMISCIDDNYIKSVIVDKYISGLSFRVIAQKNNCSKSKIFDLHNKGMQIIALNYKG